MSNYTNNTEYPLERGPNSAVRYDAQHFLWKMQKNYVIHPSIKTTENFKVADLGCGTGLWIMDLAEQLAPSAQLDGFEMSGDLFPSRDLWPDNVKYHVLNSLDSVPEQFVGKYDLVHLRMWAGNISCSQLSILTKNILNMLKPGGAVQWEDADLSRQVVQGDLAINFEAGRKLLWNRGNIENALVKGVPSAFEQQQFSQISVKEETFRPSIVPLATNTYLIALSEFIQGVKRRLGSLEDIDFPFEESMRALLNSAHSKGIVYNWEPWSLLAFKPL